MMSMKFNNLFDMRQISVLSERYLDVILGDIKNTLILFLQSPIIAALIALAWKNTDADKTLYFVICLTAVWFGCINSCREIVKERPVYQREVMVNLSTGSYVLSKMFVLGVLSFIQCLILLIIVDQYVGLPGNKLMLFISLFMCSLGGTSLGLLLSSVVGNEDKAVALVPLLIIPQILFSEILIPSDLHQGITILIEKMMLVKWGFESMKQITAATINYGIIVQDICILLLFTMAFLIISIISMKISE